MRVVFLVIGSRPGLEQEYLCGAFSSIHLARAAINWTLKRNHPDAIFRIEERESV